MGGNGIAVSSGKGDPDRSRGHTLPSERGRQRACARRLLRHSNLKDGAVERCDIQRICAGGFGVLLGRNDAIDETHVWFCQHCWRGLQRCHHSGRGVAIRGAHDGGSHLDSPMGRWDDSAAGLHSKHKPALTSSGMATQWDNTHSLLRRIPGWDALHMSGDDNTIS